MLTVFLSLLVGYSLYAAEAPGGSISSDKEFYENVDTFYDPNFDYSRFLGRVTDRDPSGNIIKVSSENKNTKLFQAGDVLVFNVSALTNRDACTAYVRDVEKDFFVLSVKDFYPCWGNDDYFRRGTQLNFVAPILSQRVKDASMYRVLLMKRKRDFMRQLNDINHFIWSYDQLRVQRAAEFDRKIVELQKERSLALDRLAAQKRENIHLQKELIYRMDKLDKDIEFQRVEKVELLRDRWAEDLNLGHPVENRPQEMKSKYRKATN